MDSDIHNNHLNQQQQQNLNSGLTRYRSAPSSYFSNLIDNGAMYGDEDLDPFFKIPSPETERILSGFIASGDNHSQGNEFMKQEQMNFSSQQQMMYQNHVQSQELVCNNNSNGSSSNSSSAVVDRLRAMDPPMNLLRQSSSPAGFFGNIHVDNGYHMMRSMDKFLPANGSVPDSPFSSTSRLKRPLARIPENDGKPMINSNGGYVSGFAGGSWDESTMLNDGFLNEFVESDQTSSSENQEKWKDEGRIRPVQAATGLAHQLSLPTSSNEVSAMQFQDNVMLRSRAKRGCATHPRSIAERVRRTRISERMRKLQDLVPNMDKQTSTADMLDLAVDYIKDLQNQVDTLADRRRKCTCSNKVKL